jgi:hypothetical protein
MRANTSHYQAMPMLVLFLLLIALAVAAPRYGVDSRADGA